jgi:hypothetical protein
MKRDGSFKTTEQEAQSWIEINRRLDKASYERKSRHDKKLLRPCVD